LCYNIILFPQELQEKSHFENADSQPDRTKEPQTDTSTDNKCR